MQHPIILYIQRWWSFSALLHNRKLNIVSHHTDERVIIMEPLLCVYYTLLRWLKLCIAELFSLPCRHMTAYTDYIDLEDVVVDILLYYNTQLSVYYIAWLTHWLKVNRNRIADELYRRDLVSPFIIHIVYIHSLNSDDATFIYCLLLYAALKLVFLI